MTADYRYIVSRIESRKREHMGYIQAQDIVEAKKLARKTYGNRLFLDFDFAHNNNRKGI